MKTKIISILLAMVMVIGTLVSCGGTGDDGVTLTTHAEYLAAEVGAEVTVETYVQNKQGWWEKEGVGLASFYTQDKNGCGYFIYEMPCSEADYALLVAGTKIRVSGNIGEYAGLREIVDATYEIISGDTYVAPATALNDKLTATDLNKYQGVFVSFTGATVVGKGDDNAPFFYGWDGNGSEGGDIYFDAKIGDATYTFVIESYLTGSETDVYKAAQNLKVGDVLDLTGYVYWYDGIQPHIISITVAD